MKRILATWAAIVLLALGSSAHAVTSPEPFVFVGTGQTDAAPPYNFTAFMTHGVVNAYTVVSWATYETADGTFNDAQIDGLQTAVEVYGGQWILGIVAGTKAPSWLYAEDAQSQFKACTGTYSVPIPWNTTFQTKWEAMVAHVAGRYANDKRLVAVVLLGINDLFNSTAFPVNTSGGTCGTTTDAVNWTTNCNSGPDPSGKGCQGTGSSLYTEALVESTVHMLGDYVRTQFPNIPLVLGPQNKFPSGNGVPVATTQRTDYFLDFATHFCGAGPNYCSGLPNNIQFYQDSSNCTASQYAIANCFLDAPFATALNTYHVFGTMQPAQLQGAFTNLYLAATAGESPYVLSWQPYLNDSTFLQFSSRAGLRGGRR